MTESMFEIRICENCGLRYPLVKGQTFGSRCPNCMGATRIALSRKLIHEPGSTTARYAPNPASGKIGFAVLLDNIRSAWNVGSVFRSADGFGFSHAYLCGITPTPEIDAVKKTSLGAEDSVPWSYHRDAVKLVKGLKREGRQIVGLEEDVE